jgi:hypothetical protein
MSKLTRILLTAFAAFALLFAGAAPALADHNAGADLDDGGDCYYGQMLRGSPAVDIRTTTYTLIRSGDSLLVACYFSLPKFVPEPPDCEAGCSADGKGDWAAPTRPVYVVTKGACVAPGALSPGGEWPDGASSPRVTDAKIVFYRTHAVLTCYWADDPTDDPGAPGGPPLP